MRLVHLALPLLLACGGLAGAAAPGGAPVASPPAAANAPAADAAPKGEPKQGDRLRDGDFGVGTRHFGLERTVEMYQWHRAGQGYFAGWSLEPVDSTGFAAGRENPGAFPIEGRQWRDLNATLDGMPLDANAIARLGQWQAFRPDFSALPGNLSATFQPEGDGLGSAENPLDPQVGDLRITWRELVLPPLAGNVVPRGGRWLLAPHLAGPGDAPIAVQEPTPADDGRRTAWLLSGALLVLGLLAFVLRRRRRRLRA